MGKGLLLLLWVVGLFVSAIVVFGALGVLPFLLVLTVWGGLSYLWFRTSLALSCLPLVLLILIALILPGISVGRPLAHRYQCANNLKQLYRALFNYETQKGRLPAAHTDMDGKPARSWRTALLPYIDRESLYKQIDLSKPWDGPFGEQDFEYVKIEAYFCPSVPGCEYGGTNYFAVVDSRTVWPPEHRMSLEDIKDGSANTILLIETTYRHIQWYEPRDLSFDEAADVLTTVPKWPPHVIDQGLLYKPAPSLNVAMADGRVYWLPLPLPKDLAESLLTAAGGEEPWDGKVGSYYVPELDWVKIAALAVFVVLSVLPAGVFFTGHTRPESSDAKYEQSAAE